MKKTFRFSALIFVALLTVRCDITDPDPDPLFDHFISFKVDGRSEEYSGPYVGGVISGSDEDTNIHVHVITAMKDPLSGVIENAIGLYFYHDSPDLLADHTYVSNYQEIQEMYKNLDDYEDDYETLVSATALSYYAFYSDEQGVLFYAYPLQDVESQVTTEYSVRFTSISADVAEGTFEAILYDRDSGRYVSITEGKFRLPYYIDES